MARARKLPSGNWRVRVYAGKDGNKKIIKSFTAPTKKEAEYLAAEFALTQKEKSNPLKMPLGQAIDRYIESRNAILSPSTIRGYRQVRKHFFSDIIDIPLSLLTQEMIQISINKSAASHSPKTIRNAHGLLSATLTEYLPEMKLRTKLPQKVKYEMTIPTDDNIIALMKHVKGTYMETAILLAAETGMRRSEICALTKPDIDFEKRTVSINKAVVLGENMKLYVKSPKSHAGTRTIEVSDAVLNHLKKIKTEQIIPVTPNTITDSYCKLKKKFNLKYRFHDLRHYNASIMLALGVPDKYAMERLGQSTPSVLRNVYQHIIDEKRQEVSKNINAYFKAARKKLTRKLTRI